MEPEIVPSPERFVLEQHRRQAIIWLWQVRIISWLLCGLLAFLVLVLGYVAWMDRDAELGLLSLGMFGVFMFFCIMYGKYWVPGAQQCLKRAEEDLENHPRLPSSKGVE